MRDLNWQGKNPNDNKEWDRLENKILRQTEDVQYSRLFWFIQWAPHPLDKPYADDRPVP